MRQRERVKEMVRVLMNDLVGCCTDAAGSKPNYPSWLFGRMSGNLLALRELNVIGFEGTRIWEGMARYLAGYYDPSDASTCAAVAAGLLKGVR